MMCFAWPNLAQGGTNSGFEDGTNRGLEGGTNSGFKGGTNSGKRWDYFYLSLWLQQELQDSFRLCSFGLNLSEAINLHLLFCL